MEKIDSQRPVAEGPLEWVLLSVGIVAAILLLFTAQAPTDIRAQLVIAGVLTALLIVLRFFADRGWPRQAFLLLGAFISVRYILWRGMHTLGWFDLPSEIASLVLFLAEVYGVSVYLLGIFVNLNPLDRRLVPLSADPGKWPTVDVFISTYNESFDIARATLLAAIQIDYPQSKLKVHLLDDGGTDQKLNDPDPQKGVAARERQQRLQTFCEQLGVRYLTRKLNQHAKAGNINSALAQTGGDLILLLDVDHIPTRDILTKTVGFFERDPKLWLVQTSHFFGNPDPIERNLDIFAYMPGESEMFYGVVQRGLDFWNASFFCGSAGVLRRKLLEEIGGIACETVTEDAETSIKMHGLGYHSAYLPYPMISGLAPETFSGFIVQRIRWAQGMIQIFLLKNPFRVAGLKLQQRLAYFSSTFFWFFPYARVVFLFAPVAYLVFGLHIYNANFLQIIGYTVPHLAASMIVSEFLFGKVRWTFISELYEIIQSFFCFGGIFEVFRNPRSPTFKVTPKGETLSQDFISPLARPFYVFLGLTLLAMACGLARLFLVAHPHERYAVIVTLLWTVFNAVILLASLGVIFEHRQRRVSGRLPADFTALIGHDENFVSGSIHDLSEGGASLLLDDDKPLSLGLDLILKVAPYDQETSCDLGVRLRNQRLIGQKILLGLEFTPSSFQEISDKISLVFGSSQRWLKFQRSREHRIGIYRSIVFLLWLGLKGLLEQLAHQKNRFLTRFHFAEWYSRVARRSPVPASPLLQQV
jgi:cellulose synthase (UDP-forming)